MYGGLKHCMRYQTAFLEWSAYNMHMSMLMNIMEYLRYVMPAGRDGQAEGAPT